MDYAKIRGAIRAIFGTQAAFAAALGVSECALSQKLNDRSEWTATEIRKTCELLAIPAIEIPLYFFEPKVEKTQQEQEAV